jgi:hypothetical protein
MAGEQAQGFEFFEDFFAVGLLGALEGGTDLVDGPSLVGAGDQVADGGDLFGKLLGPGGGGDRGYLAGGFVGVFGGGKLFLGRGLGAFGILKFRAQPADEAAVLFGCALPRFGATGSRLCAIQPSTR